MGHWRDPSSWLITVLGGALAAIVAGYFLYFFPPDRSLRHAETIPSPRTEQPPALDRTLQEAQRRPSPSKMRSSPGQETSYSDLEPRLVDPDQESLDESRVREISPGNPVYFADIDTGVNVSFRETLGSRYAEFVVTAPGRASFRFPARSGGTTREFEVNGRRYELSVVEIDWQRLKSQLTLQPVN